MTFTVTASLCYSTTHLHPTFNQLHSSAPVKQTPANSTGIFRSHSRSVYWMLLALYNQLRNLRFYFYSRQLIFLQYPLCHTTVVTSQAPSPLVRSVYTDNMLNSLLPTTVYIVEVVTAPIVGQSNSSHIEVRNYNDSIIKLKVTHEVKLNVSASRASCMFETVNSFQRRIVRNQKKLSSEKRKEASSELLTGEHAALKVRDQINTHGSQNHCPYNVV